MTTSPRGTSGLFATEREAVMSCIEHRSHAQWGMTFEPKRVEGGWIVEQDCTPEFVSELRGKYPLT